mmetsp:Transcript_21595/g.60282  ORF Transcript_21595/g.60282 Transcript_21595/m.60282 type:complete len:82 (-) Transcript_21595:133-378(-)
MENFCFLKRARKELVGTAKSSYLQLAAYLGGPSLKLTRMYQYVTPYVEARRRERDIFEKSVGPNWTNPELAARIRFEEYFD